MAFLGFGRNKNGINLEMDGGQTAVFVKNAEDLRSDSNGLKHTGKFLRKQDKILIFGIYASKEYAVAFGQGDNILASYAAQSVAQAKESRESKARYNFRAKVTELRKASDSDPADAFEIDEAAGRLSFALGFDKYIIGILPVSEPEKAQIREYYRMPEGIDIYCKPPADAVYSKMTAGGGEPDQNGGRFDETQYPKLRTVNISGGGFSCLSETHIKEGSILDCLIIAGGEALPAEVKILSSRPADGNEKIYEIRAAFEKISDEIRDRLTKYILSRQRQQQAVMRKRKSLRE
jgi:hypothetical protein